MKRLRSISQSLTLPVLIAGVAFAGDIRAERPASDADGPVYRLELKPIDRSRVGKAMPDSSAAMDINGDGQVEILTSMQDANGHPEVLLYQRTGDEQWERTSIGIVKGHKEEMEWVAIGRPFPGDPRVCVAASVQHKDDGLVVFRLRAPGLSPFESENWEQGVAKEFAGQGLVFHDVTGDGVDELIYATQAGNELGILQANKGGNHLEKSGWTDHVIDSGNKRSWWWFDGKFYDLNGNGLKNDFFISTRRYGGSDLGMWKVVQTRPNDPSSYSVEKIYNGDSLFFDTGYLFSSDRDRRPDIVMVSIRRKEINMFDGRNDYALTRIPFHGAPWNVKILPFLGGERDAFVVAAAESPSLFWSYQWQNGAYEVRKETGYAGDYRHPMDGLFTIADVDGDGKLECITPDSSPDKKSKGLAYLKAVPVTEDGGEVKVVDRFKLE